MMMIFILLISVLYSILIAWFVAGWHKTKTISPNSELACNRQVSVIVACKNESQTLPTLFEALKNQSNQNFQLILVDDNSTDSSLEIMHAAVAFLDVLILKSEGVGKKQALKTGIQQARNELIITTDADCTPSTSWIESMTQFYNQQKLDLLIGPVEIKPQTTFWGRIQQLEFQTLIASGACAAGQNHAIMCNGANLAFHKTDWLAQYHQINPQLQSGDDVFFLHAMKKEEKKIAFVRSQQAMVYTNACSTFKQFYIQRKRWASKSPAYTDRATITIATLIFSISFTQVWLVVLIIFNSLYFNQLLILSGIKLLLDWLFIQQTKQLFQKRKTAFSTLALAVLYPFYIVSSAFAGLLQGIIDIRKDKHQSL